LSYIQDTATFTSITVLSKSNLLERVRYWSPIYITWICW